MIPPFDQQELKEFFNLLIQRRAKLIKEIAVEKEPFNSGEGPGDLVDMATSLLERELDFRLTAKEKNSLEEIDYALERIKDNIYGICVDTHEPIAKDRLLAVPEALRTLKAQEAYEAKFKKEKTID